MVEKRRVPKEETKFNLWYQNFNNNLPSVASQVGVSEAELTRVANDSPAWSYLMLRNEIIRAYKSEESEVKKAAYLGETKGTPLNLPSLNVPVKPDGITFNQGIWNFANNLVQVIVKRDECTPEIEALLDIEIKEGDDVSPDELKQVIKQATPLNGGVVRIKCSLMGKKAYGVYSQRGASEAFEHIGNSTEQEFLDERPNLTAGQPEARKYKTICLENNKPVGEYSAIETVITKP